MNVGIIIPHSGVEKMRRIFADVAAQGFRHGQLVSWDPGNWNDENAAEVNALTREFGVEITAFWCGWSGPRRWNFTEGPETLGIVPALYREERIRDLLDGAAYARKIGVRDVVTHMGFIPENMTDPAWPGVVSAVKALAEELKKNGQNLLFETGQETPVVLLRLFTAVGTGNLYINLDPANLILYGKANPVDALDVLGGLVRGVHAKDGLYPTDGLELGREVKVGEGKVNFPLLLKRLKETGFDGSLTIEREISGEQQIRDILETKEYLSGLIGQLEKEGTGKLKVGMAGLGGISQSHIAAWSQIPEAAIVAVCDIREEQARKGAEATGARVYTDLDEMLDRENLDILDICLPTYLHADFAVKALNRGIHVLAEKPISLKREDVARVYAAARENERRFMVAQVLRFWREYEALREAIHTEKYGKLLSGHMARLGNTPKWSWENWMTVPEKSGLVPFDLHIHDLDFLVYTLGKPENMICHRVKTDTQDYFTTVYEYPGFFVSTEAAWYAGNYAFQSSYRFQFERAVMEYRGGKLTVYPADGSAKTMEEETAPQENGINLPSTNAYFNEIRYFTDCVLAGKDCDRIKPEELECVLDLITVIDSKI